MQEKLSEQGANFQAGLTDLKQVVHDKNLITGQNPRPLWTLAEDVIAALGYPPLNRVITPEENSVTLLGVYKKQGNQQAKQHLQSHPFDYQEHIIIMHAIISFMKMEIIQGKDLLLLADMAKGTL